MSTEDHVSELLPAYALDILDGEELLSVAEHITACAACRAELAGYQALVAELCFGAPAAPLSPQVKRRLLARLGTQPAPARSRTAAASASWLSALLSRQMPVWAALVLVLVLATGALWLAIQSGAGERNASGRVMQTIALSGTEATPHTSGLLVIGDDGQAGALVVEHLPPLHDGQQYQLWLIKDGQRTSGAVFSVDADGYGVVQVTAPEALSSYSGFGVTVEPFGGSPGPTSPKVLGS